MSRQKETALSFRADNLVYSITMLKAQAQWKFFDKQQYKRRGYYKKELTDKLYETIK
jgi:hypothetical protein